MSDLAKVGKSIFFAQRKNKGGEYPYRITPPHAVGFVLRSGVAPQRCSVSYTLAKLGKVLENSKSFWEKVAKKGEVSHEVGEKKGETFRFPPIRIYTLCRLRRPKQFRVWLLECSSELSHQVSSFIQCECVRSSCRNSNI